MPDPSPRPAPPRPGLLRHLAAIVYDALLLAGVLMCAQLVPFTIGIAVYGLDAFRDFRNPLVGNPLNETWLVLVSFAFYGGFWVHGGQTLGLRAWKLRVQAEDGGGVGWWPALLRFLCGALWLAPAVYLHKVLGVGVWPSLGAGLGCLLLTILTRLHERYSGTVLVRAAPRPR